MERAEIWNRLESRPRTRNLVISGQGRKRVVQGAVTVPLAAVTVWQLVAHHYAWGVVYLLIVAVLLIGLDNFKLRLLASKERCEQVVRRKSSFVDAIPQHVFDLGARERAADKAEARRRRQLGIDSDDDD